MKNTSIQIDSLVKNYGDIQAVRSVSFQIQEGELFGLIGPDGAGKTSLFRIMASLLTPDSGTASVSGFDPVLQYQEVRQIIGYMPGKFSLYQDLSIAENLEFFAAIFDTSLEENYELIADIYQQIEPFKNRKTGALSGGMKQKLALCCALIHKPKILLLDEPTTGVDPVSRKEFWQMLQRLKEKGITIVVSTPYMDEASLCDRVALIQNGEILQIESPENITKHFPKSIYFIRAKEMYRLLQCLRDYPEVGSAYSFGEEIHFTFENGKEDRLKLESFVSAYDFTDLSVRVGEPSIEDCFMALMNDDE